VSAVRNSDEQYFRSRIRTGNVLNELYNKYKIPASYNHRDMKINGVVPPCIDDFVTLLTQVESLKFLSP